MISSEDSAESSDGDEFPEPSTPTPRRAAGKEGGEQGQGCRNLQETYMDTLLPVNWTASGKLLYSKGTQLSASW